MKSEVSVSLTLTGIDLDPEKITEEIGIKPSEIWRKGELVDPRAIIRYKKNGWRLLSPLENFNRIADPNDLEILTRSLLEKLQPVWDTAFFVKVKYRQTLATTGFQSQKRTSSI